MSNSKMADDIEIENVTAESAALQSQDSQNSMEKVCSKHLIFSIAC